MSITHNENLNPLLNLLINCMSARLLIEILSFLIAPAKVFYQKIYKPLKQDPFVIYYISDF